MAKALNAKQEKFCHNIVADPKANGTLAAINAGYSERSAASIASELLKKPEIKKRIKALNAKSVEISEATARRVVEEIELLALSDMGQFVDFREGQPIRTVAFDKLPYGATRCIKKFKFKRRVIETDTSGTTENPGPTTAVVEETCEIELWSKTDSLDMLARKHGLYEVLDEEGDGTRTVNFNFVRAVKPGK